ncbi:MULTISPECIES: hypothetical protein [Streptomyces]|uniref:Lipoprotein n=1 Tax=Streptomyces clavifer TaxID=68188 RepID=A0ABS4VB00_9ACTN|nr:MULTISPECIES: hypothetical protein [Streptomyces]MBP2361077.1 hypothetical protein [Streptomyces clavifer]MDX2746289.1 hypothetical protein [Streptomyces sp. NRRL_B-2557]GHA95547.1 hypothetical protein GCM10010392_22840 [Streptomyces clavifer]
MRRWLTAAGLVMALGAGSVACASEKKEEKTFVGADEVCGDAFAGPLAEMVEKATGDKLFFAKSPKGMERVVAALKDGYESGRPWAAGDTLCLLRPKGAKQTDKGGVKFSMYSPQDVVGEGLSAGQDLYTMGVQSVVGRGNAALFFECVTPQLKGSDKTPLRIQGGFGRGESDAPDTREYRNLNMTILHAVSLKLVKALDCENNGGLPKDPVLTPK